MSRTPTPDLPRLPELGDDDLEQLLRGAFDARTRAEVPDDRVPPAMQWPSARAARRSWLTPLAVAASIAVVAAGGGLAIAQQHRTQQAPPATQTVTAEPTSASPTSSTETPSATATGTATGTASTSVAPPATSSAPGSTSTRPSGPSVTAAGATLVVPAGYTFRQDLGSNGSSPIGRRWCFDTTGTTDCTFAFSALAPQTNPLDADTEGDYESNPEYCPQVNGNRTSLTDYHDLTFGGRAAEFRSWHWACGDGSSHDIAQYSVMTPAPFNLFTDRATPTVLAAMADVVSSARLPAATGTIRYYDHGNITAAVAQADGSTVVQLDRVAVGWPNQSTATYAYRVPAGMTFTLVTTSGTQQIPASGLVGRTVTLHTDGRVVTDGVITSS